MKTVLIVEDEDALRKMLAFNLERSGFGVKKARDCSAAKALLNTSLPDVILLDWMLPGQTGLEFIKELRADEVLAELPIILLTAKAEEDDKILGLDSGADDYITKPFSKRELISRIKAQLRRSKSSTKEEITVGDLCLNTASRKASIADSEIHLGPTEYRLLELFLQNQDRVYSREQLLNRVWRDSPDVDERTVDVHIRRLRKALSVKGYDQYIHTVRGAGYRFTYISN